MKKIEVFYNSKPVIEAKFESVQGIEPGKGYAILPDCQEDVSAQSGTLIFRDSNSSVSLSNLVVTATKKIKESANSEFLQVEFADKRILWKNFNISGAFNCTKPDGTTFSAETLKNNVPYSLAELIALCLQTAGESITSGMLPQSSVIPRNIRWVNKPIDQALKELLALGNLSLILLNTGEIQVFRKSENYQLPEFKFILKQEKIKFDENSDLPGKLKILGGRTIREKLISGTWEPVCISDGSNNKKAGEIYSLSEIATDFGLTLMDLKKGCLFDAGFDNVSGATEEIKENRKQILKKCAFKWFKMPQDATPLPWLPHRADTDSEGNFLPINVKHTFFRVKNEAPANFADPFENVTSPSESSFSKDFDLEQGIIKFKDVQGNLNAATGEIQDTRLEGRILTVSTQIQATVAFEIPENENDARFSNEFIISPENERLFTVELSDFVLRQSDDGSTIVNLNETELEEASANLSKAYVNSRINQKVEKFILAGAQNYIASDGILKVSWLASANQGLTTEILTGCEIPTFSTFPELRKPKIAANQISQGDKQILKEINAYSVGPVVLKADETIAQNAYSFAEVVPDNNNCKLENLGPARNVFFWDRDLEPGGWFNLSLASVISGSQPNFQVRESDENSEFPSGSKLLDVTNLDESELKPEDLVIVLNTHNEHKVAFPLKKRLVCDHINGDETQDNLSTEVAESDASKTGDLDDITWVKRDKDDVERLMLNINNADGPQSWYTGKGLKTEAVAQLGGDNGVLVSPGACNRHILGKNSDGENVIQGHITTHANFYQDSIGDGEIHFVQAIRNMREHLFGKYYKADMWWDYDKQRWIPWFQSLWQQIPVDRPVTENPIYRPVREGGILEPNPAGACENPNLDMNLPNYLGSNSNPWAGIFIGTPGACGQSLKGGHIKGADREVKFMPPDEFDTTIYKFADGSILELECHEDNQNQTLMRFKNCEGSTVFEAQVDSGNLMLKSFDSAKFKVENLSAINDAEFDADVTVEDDVNAGGKIHAVAGFKVCSINGAGDPCEGSVIQTITQIRDNGTNIQCKKRDLQINGGIITDIGTESDWQDI